MSIRNIKSLKAHPKAGYFFDDITGTKWENFLESIRNNGVITPLIITPDGVIISGYQRYRACKELGIQTVRCQEMEFETADEEVLAMIDTNIQQRGVVNSPSVKLGRILLELERIRGVSGRDHGGCAPAGALTKKEMLAAIGVDKKVANCSKAVAKMPKEMQDIIDSGVISPRVAYDNLAGMTVMEQQAVAEAIRKENMDRVDTGRIKKMLGRNDRKGELQMLKTDSIYHITRNILGQNVTISLTDDEAATIVRQWIDRAAVKEPETKWKPVKAYATGVIAQHAEEAIRLYQEGNSCAEIASHFGVTSNTVSRFLRNNGVKMRTPQDAGKLRWSKKHAA